VLITDPRPGSLVGQALAVALCKLSWLAFGHVGLRWHCGQREWCDWGDVGDLV